MSRPGNNQGATIRGVAATPVWRSLGRRLLSLIRTSAMLGVLLAVGWGGWLMYRNIDVPVNVIRVEGEFLYSKREEVAGLVEPLIQRGFLGLNLETVREVLEADPWIERAEVRREWPDTLHIVITEETPIARWGEQGFLNRRGEPLQVEDRRGLEELPLLHGGSGDARRVMAQYRDVSQLLRPLGLRVSEFHYQPRGSWLLVLQQGVTVQLGRGPIMEKVRRFIAVYQQVLKERFAEVKSVDTRYVNGVAVRWKTAAS